MIEILLRLITLSDFRAIAGDLLRYRASWDMLTCFGIVLIINARWLTERYRRHVEG